MANLKILIVGGYGVFGGRIVDLLSDGIDLTIVVAGRSCDRAADFCVARNTRSRLVPARFDRGDDLIAQLLRIAPDVVVDASGPFQAYGDDPYALARAAIECGCTYLDLADGADFAAGISVLDASAREKGVAVLSGVSSFPVLTAAVVRSLSKDLASVDAVTGGIAPSPHAGVGANVVAAVASYAGRPLALRRDGRDAQGNGLAEYRRMTVAPPGVVPLLPLRFSLVDVPDLRAIPKAWPEVRSVWMGAAPVPRILHGALNGLARLVALGILPGLGRLSPVIHLATRIFAFGEHRGGMFVEVAGTTSDGRGTVRTWHLVAEGDDGPLIPSMAVEALVRRMVGGRMPAPGARTATLELELEDYETLFAGRSISTGTRSDEDPSGSPFATVLGKAWTGLPEALRRFHSGPSRSFSGTADVERGRSPAAVLVARIFRFPAAGRNIPVVVSVKPDSGGEIWTRRFGTERFDSRVDVGRGRNQGLATERFGPFVFGLALVSDCEGIRLVQRTWSFLGVPLPSFLAPDAHATETDGPDGSFRFDIDVRLPLIGRIVRYSGRLDVGVQATNDERNRSS